MSYVQVNDVTLEYVEQGSGIPVIFSHGGHSDLRYWEPQQEIFSAHYQFVAYSHRLHGSSTGPADTDYSAEAHVADLVAVIRRLVSGPVHMVGFSTAIALRATLAEPELVRSLTIIEPNVPWLLDGDPDGEAVLAWWRNGKERVDTQAAGDKERVAKLWFELVNNRGPHVFDVQPEEFRRMWFDNFGRKRPTPPSPEPLTCDKLSAITTPTLVLEAEHGMPYSRLIVARLTKCISGCRHVIIPNVTHFMSYQHPAMFNQVVLDFLAHHDKTHSPSIA